QVWSTESMKERLKPYLSSAPSILATQDLCLRLPQAITSVAFLLGRVAPVIFQASLSASLMYSTGLPPNLFAALLAIRQATVITAFIPIISLTLYLDFIITYN